MNPLVSVIIPVFQGARIIVGAVSSALNQTYRNIEVIVVNDGSTDETQAVLKTIADPRLHVLSQANQGTAAARNLALAQAKGSYVAFLDSDDRWLPDKIESEVRTLQNVPEQIGVAYSSYFAVDDAGRLLNLAPARSTAGYALEELLDGDDYLMPSLCLFDRRIFDAIGTFNVGRYHEDHEFILRVTRQFPIFPTARRLTVYRQSTSGKCRAILSDFERARREELSLLEDLTGTFTPAQLERLRRNVLRSLYCRFLMYGFDEFARRLGNEVDFRTLLTSKKGMLALVFAKTGINFLLLARTTVQTFYIATRQGWWMRELKARGLDLRYG